MGQKLCVSGAGRDNGWQYRPSCLLWPSMPPLTIPAAYQTFRRHTVRADCQAFDEACLFRSVREHDRL